MARDVDKIQHKLQKETYEENWYRKTAEAMDIEVDSMDEFVFIFHFVKKNGDILLVYIIY